MNESGRTRSTISSKLGSRLLFPLLVSLLGAAITLVVWWSSLADWRLRLQSHFAAVAKDSHGILADRTQTKVTALQRLAGYWRMYGLGGEPEWQYLASSVLTQFPGIAWIAWVPTQESGVRIAVADSTLRPTREQLDGARQRLNRPEDDVAHPSRSGDVVQYFVPVRAPGDTLGVMTAAIVPQALLGQGALGTSDIVAYSVWTQDGRELFRSGTPARDAPPRVAVELDLPEQIGPRWHVRYEPTAEYLSSAYSAWPNYFLFTGLLLSLTLGLLALQFVRLRDTSEALAVSNRKLDAQVRELSERDRALRDLNESLEAKVQIHTADLREAMRELEAFTHSISHDLRSPLGSIMNYSAVLEEDFGPRMGDEGRRMLHRIQASGKTATVLLDQLVTFAWVGRADEEQVTLDMTKLAREAYHEAASAESENGTFEIDLQELPPARGEPTLLSRVFRNLIHNALKYARPRDVRRIQIGGFAGESENTYFVADNGIGFDPELKEKIFEPFRRLSAVKEFEGSGLGLAIVAKIVRKHGGKIWAESDGKTGARFFFTLPREEATT